MKQSAAQFDSYIETLLGNSRLKDIFNVIGDDYSDMESAIVSFKDVMLDTGISAKFDADGYEDDRIKTAVYKKLADLVAILDENFVSIDSTDYKIVVICLKKVEDGWALTEEITDYLNKIYKQYSHE
jgi:hypothetical protein